MHHRFPFGKCYLQVPAICTFLFFCDSKICIFEETQHKCDSQVPARCTSWGRSWVSAGPELPFPGTCQMHFLRPLLGLGWLRPAKCTCWIWFQKCYKEMMMHLFICNFFLPFSLFFFSQISTWMIIWSSTHSSGPNFPSMISCAIQTTIAWFVSSISFHQWNQFQGMHSKKQISSRMLFMKTTNVSEPIRH